MIYQWKSGSRHGCDANVAGEVCESLASSGRLTPKGLVDESRPEDAPLHGEFEWNDRVAAEAYRESQASYIIRSLEVVVEATGEEEQPIRAFFAMQEGEPHEYTPVMAIMDDDRRREMLLHKALQELMTFKQKYKSLTELSKLFEEIDQLQLAV